MAAKRRQRRPSASSVVAAMVIIGATGSVAGFVFNTLYPRGLFHPAPAVGQKPASPKKTPEKTRPVKKTAARPAVKPSAPAAAEPSPKRGPTEPEVVSAEEALRILKEGKVIWIDARSRSSYEYSHVPGAINLPAGEFAEEYPKLSPRLPKDARIIVYCSSRNCDDSGIVLEQMVKIGYRPRNLLYFKDGWDMWEILEYPQEKGGEAR